MLPSKEYLPPVVKIFYHLEKKIKKLERFAMENQELYKQYLVKLKQEEKLEDIPF